jgi:hypothetical protein
MSSTSGTSPVGDPEDELIPAKVPVAGACPECGRDELRRYPVLAAEGWFEVVKCQHCLGTLSREPWHRLGWVRLPEDAP